MEKKYRCQGGAMGRLGDGGCRQSGCKHKNAGSCGARCSPLAHISTKTKNIYMP